MAGTIVSAIFITFMRAIDDLPAEAVHRFAVVVFACLGDGLGPVGVVQAVGIELGLQCHAGALAVEHAALALFVQVVAGIELDAGAVGIHRHGTAGNRIGKLGTGIAEDFPVVIVAPLQVQGFIVSTDVPTDGLGETEIHRGTLHTPQFPSGDAFGIVGVKEPAG